MNTLIVAAGLFASIVLLPSMLLQALFSCAVIALLTAACAKWIERSKQNSGDLRR
jgi:hypothetical protein